MNETNLLKQQLEGQINVLREQINTARMNDEHYDNRLNTVQSEINMRKEQKASFEEERKIFRKSCVKRRRQIRL